VEVLSWVSILSYSRLTRKREFYPARSLSLLVGRDCDADEPVEEVVNGVTLAHLVELHAIEGQVAVDLFDGLQLLELLHGGVLQGLLLEVELGLLEFALVSGILGLLL